MTPANPSLNPNGRPRRLLLKLSGESLCTPGGFGVDHARLASISAEIRGASQTGARLAIVIGGGNIIRGADLARTGDIHRTTADHMGMLGTVVNALAIVDKLTQIGTPAAALSAFEVRGIVEPFSRTAAAAHLDAGRVVVLGGGTGNPFFSTDSGAALRAAQLDCDELLKATKVDGVYTADPAKDPSATRFDTLTLGEALARGLGVMDHAGMAICRDSGIPVRVFKFETPGNIARVARGESVGTLVTP